MITRADVAGLREGDVVELRYDAQTVVRGHLRPHVGSGLSLHGGLVLRRADGDPANSWVLWDLTVVSRAPRPLYVNHPRTEPVAGDIVNYKSSYTGSVIGPFLYGYVERWAGAPSDGRMTRWVGLPGCGPDTGPLYNTGSLRLLVDGETGRCVQ